MPLTFRTASRFGNAPLSFFEESHIAHHRTELLRPFIIDNSASQRFEASAVSTGQDDSPFMFAFHGDRLTGAGTAREKCTALLARQ